MKEIMERKNIEKEPKIVIGHSLGGCIACEMVESRKLENVLGLVVIDVVEGKNKEI